MYTNRDFRLAETQWYLSRQDHHIGFVLQGLNGNQGPTNGVMSGLCAFCDASRHSVEATDPTGAVNHTKSRGVPASRREPIA